MKIQYAANFVSSIAYLPQVEAAAGTNTGAAYSAQIQDLLRQAQASYRQRKYADAIDHYKAAQSLIYGLLYPQHRVDFHLANPAMMLPVGKATELKIAEASLKLAEVIKPSAAAPSYPVAATGFVPPADQAAWEKIGLVDQSASPAVTNKITAGVNLLSQGQATQAMDALNEAIAGLGQAVTPDAQAARAAATLNLSSAQLLTGNAQQAAASAANAGELFTSLKDDVGRAQALHNQAAALQASGQAAQAKPLLEQAATLLKTTAAPFQPPPASPVPAAPAALPMLMVAEPVSAAVSHAGAAVAFAPAVSSGIASAVLTATVAAKTRPDLSFQALNFIENQNTSTVSVRWLGTSAGWGGIPVLNPAQAAQQKKTWSLGVESVSQVKTLDWAAGVRPQPQALLDAIYQPRLAATALTDLMWRPKDTSETTAWLAHLYSFVIPQALGDCYAALGNHARADQYYMQAAQYSYINVALEGTALWARMARNIAQWGDHLYRNEVVDEAKTVYSKLVLTTGKAATGTPMYTLPAFATAIQEANKVFVNLANPAAAGANPAIASPILIVWARWQYLNAGLDYFGTSFTPIFTFDYLQQVARELTQQAIQAESQYIDFQARAEQEAATRRDLQAAATLADAEVGIRDQLYQASQSDTAAANAAVNLANLRVTQATNDRNAYQSAGYWQYVSQSIAAAHSAHEDWHGAEIRKLAADMERGSWEGNYGKLAAAATLLGGQKSYEYQLQRLQDNINETQATVPIATAQAAAARSRQEAARLTVEEGRTRAALAHDALAAFDNEVFTPELWSRMAEAMLEISRGYQEWAIRSAKLMERAYNFENDRNLKVIKSSYPASSTNGLLGANYLLQDIDSFTYDFVVQTRSKTSSLKDVVSLANQYPFHFYGFQNTGNMTFETTLHDFDMLHPGFYGQRIQAVDVEMVGLMPPGGVHGTLRAGGISRYRTQAAGGSVLRVHTADTLALSEFELRNDAFLFKQDSRIRGLFEGCGVATTWNFELPRRSNNLDYRLITDVRLVLYYTARFDSALEQSVLTAPPLAGEMIHVKPFQLRFDFPEAWYTLLDSGQMQFQVGPEYLPRNETNFKLDKLTITLMPAAGVSGQNVVVTVTLPGKAPAAMTTDATASVATVSGNPLAGVMGGDLLGGWTLKLEPQAGSALRSASGGLRGDLLDNIAVIAQYSFSWPA